MKREIVSANASATSANQNLNEISKLLENVNHTVLKKEIDSLNEMISLYRTKLEAAEKIAGNS